MPRCNPRSGLPFSPLLRWQIPWLFATMLREAQNLRWIILIKLKMQKRQWNWIYRNPHFMCIWNATNSSEKETISFIFNSMRRDSRQIFQRWRKIFYDAKDLLRRWKRARVGLFFCVDFRSFAAKQGETDEKCIKSPRNAIYAKYYGTCREVRPCGVNEYWDLFEKELFPSRRRCELNEIN